MLCDLLRLPFLKGAIFMPYSFVADFLFPNILLHILAQIQVNWSDQTSNLNPQHAEAGIELSWQSLSARSLLLLGSLVGCQQVHVRSKHQTDLQGQSCRKSQNERTLRSQWATNPLRLKSSLLKNRLKKKDPKSSISERQITIQLCFLLPEVYTCSCGKTYSSQTSLQFCKECNKI